MIPLPQSIQTYGELCLVNVDRNIKYYVGFRNMLNGIELILLPSKLTIVQNILEILINFEHIKNNGFNSRWKNMKDKKLPFIP